MTEWIVDKRMTNDRPNDDAALALRVAKNPEAFAEIYERYAIPVYRYIFSRVGHPENAEDITSQVFLEALEHIHNYHPVGTFAAWLFTIARRRSADFFRKSRPIQDLDDETARDPSDLLSTVIRDEDFKILEEQLQNLDEPDREMLRLRFAAGLSFGDIGVLLGKNSAAVKTATYRLLVRMERNMEASNDRKL